MMKYTLNIDDTDHGVFYEEPHLLYLFPVTHLELELLDDEDGGFDIPYASFNMLNNLRIVTLYGPHELSKTSRTILFAACPLLHSIRTTTFQPSANPDVDRHIANYPPYGMIKYGLKD